MEPKVPTKMKVLHKLLSFAIPMSIANHFSNVTNSYFIYLCYAEADHWFCKTADGWGFPRFMKLSDLHDSKNGFLFNDTLIVEAQILIVGILKNLV